MITGTAMRPVLAINSSQAPASSATFFDVNGTPRDERNSFAVWQDCQVEDQYTETVRFVIVLLVW